MSVRAQVIRNESLLTLLLRINGKLIGGVDSSCRHLQCGATDNEEGCSCT